MKRIGWVKAPRGDKNKQQKKKILEGWVKFSKRVAEYKGLLPDCLLLVRWPTGDAVC